MQTLLVVSVWLHILAAMVWIGGMTFLTFALVPVLRRPDCRGHAAELIRLTGRRFRTVGWICFTILGITGTLNIYARGWFLPNTGFWQSEQGSLLMWKIALFALVLVLSLFHDFAIGSAAVRKMEENPGSEEAMSLRRAASWMGRLNLGLALAIVALAVLLVRGVP